MSASVLSTPTETLAADLREDLLAAWSPDVAASVELEAYDPTDSVAASYVAQRLDVPRPGGSTAQVRVLHPAWHMALHRAVAPLREASDAHLSAGVFGYRLGAKAGRRYADDWRAFCDFVNERSEAYAFVAVTDVKSFFANTPWSRAVKAVTVFANGGRRDALARVAASLAGADVPRLPTGYSDARLLANLVLADAERDLQAPFARWVDDYRIFVNSSSEAEAALKMLDQGLARLRLERNLRKTHIMPSHEAVERHHQTLASVYHPDRDSADAVASSLHRVLDEAMSDPVANRRMLRFVLPRLAEQRDDAAIPFALRGLTELPWEAPRLVGYLAAFTDSHDLAPAVSGAVMDAATRNDSWALCRLAPLAARIQLSSDAVRTLDRSHDSFAGTPCWGLVLRVLALSGNHSVVRRNLAGPSPDARAVLTAARDLEYPIPQWLRRAEPVLASVLASDAAPELVTASLL